MRIRRRHILIYMIILSSICLAFIISSYDVYSRNKTVTKANKHILEDNLSKEDKQLLIDDNIDVNLFIGYVGTNSFELKNYEYYNIIKKYVPKISNQEIVESGNIVAQEDFTLKSLEKILGNKIYSLDQIIRLSTLTSSYYPESKPNFYPNEKLSISNQDWYVADYTPNTLKEINKSYTKNKKKILLEKEALKQFDLLCDNLKAITNKTCGGLKVEMGYVSYKDAKSKTYPFHLVPGHNDFQLGKTILFSDSKHFYKNNVYLWLTSNAHRFGYVQRYPVNKAEITKVSNQYGIFRYVGIKNATEMYNKGITLEETK